MAASTETRSVPALIDELAKEGVTLDRISLAKQDLIQHGLEAVEPLLQAQERRRLSAEAVSGLLRAILPKVDPTADSGPAQALEKRLKPSVDAAVRRTVMRLLEEGLCLSTHVCGPLFENAEDRAQPVPLRCQALATLARAPLRRGAEERLLALLSEPEVDVALAVLATLERQAAVVDHGQVERALWQAAASDQAVLRRRAIALLGTFGEIDAVERACLLPTPDPADIEAVQDLVRRLLQRPRHVHRLKPENFEHLICHLLQKMGFAGVEVTGRPYDSGIDLRAHRDEASYGRPERRRYLVQCKRHRDPIDADQVQGFIDQALRGDPGAHGLFVATTTFTAAAVQAHASHRLDLMDHQALQAQLDQHFGPGCYTMHS